MSTLRLATTRRGYTLQNGTTVPDQTEWHNILLWRRLAETVEKYVHKGDKLYIEGSIHTRTYDDRNGVKRYRTEIWADTMELLSPKQQAPNSPAAQQDATPQPATAQAESDELPF